MRARQLIEAKNYWEARALLQTIANDPTAQKWLAQLDNIITPQVGKYMMAMQVTCSHLI